MLKIKDDKVEVAGMYTYGCPHCKKQINCYVEKKLIDNKIPIPFMDTCPYCLDLMQDISGMHKLPPFEFTIKPFEKYKNSQGVYLLLDSDIEMYGDRVCGNLHINLGDNFFSVHDLVEKVGEIYE